MLSTTVNCPPLLILWGVDVVNVVNPVVTSKWVDAIATEGPDLKIYCPDAELWGIIVGSPTVAAIAILLGVGNDSIL